MQYERIAAERAASGERTDTRDCVMRERSVQEPASEVRTVVEARADEKSQARAEAEATVAAAEARAAAALRERDAAHDARRQAEEEVHSPQQRVPGGV